MDETYDPAGHAIRQALVDCEGNAGTQVILVGLRPSEDNVTLYTPQGDPTGGLLEWYPFCTSRYNFDSLSGGYSSYEPPPLRRDRSFLRNGNLSSRGRTSPLGYITQLNFVESVGTNQNENQPCSAPTSFEAAELEWRYAWGQVQGDYRYVKTPYVDLVAQF